MQRPATIALRAELYREVTAIVDREYGDELVLEEIAHRVASSRRQLQRAFTEIGETTFREYLTVARMDHAAGMLSQSNLTIGEVARNVGYRQPAQFAKAFRRRHGETPSNYRAAQGISTQRRAGSPRAENPVHSSDESFPPRRFSRAASRPPTRKPAVVTYR
ncbi:MAG: helix-turn-helix transcriptional regulator [Actinomycetes bacterium]|jgi:AraC family transcriptional regulator, regulatory protein of adaptative response / methylphosphotriester-DNA alkyltransferase methyltransferase